jgi:hypothetical protein
MTADRLDLLFPSLSASGYEITSPAAPDYNCIAWAAEDISRWWEPVAIPLPSYYYWPPGVSLELMLASYVQAFESVGYRVCDDSLEEGVEKIALYVSADGLPTHAARQLASGEWTSKLGKSVDIRHRSLAALEGEMYGRVARLMRRPRPTQPPGS